MLPLISFPQRWRANELEKVANVQFWAAKVRARNDPGIKGKELITLLIPIRRLTAAVWEHLVAVSLTNVAFGHFRLQILKLFTFID